MPAGVINKHNCSDILIIKDQTTSGHVSQVLSCLHFMLFPDFLSKL